MENVDPSVTTNSRVSVVLWWVATLCTLVVLDDLTFGPAFWFISLALGPGWAMFAVYLTYIPVQTFLVYRATEETPGRIANWWLARLNLQRRSSRIQHNVDSVHQKVTGALSAVPLSVVIGGVLPPIILWRRGWGRAFVRRISWPCAVTYATVFGVIHGIVPSLI